MKIGKKSWRIVVIRQIRQSFFPSKVFYYTVSKVKACLNLFNWLYRVYFMRIVINIFEQKHKHTTTSKQVCTQPAVVCLI